MFNFRKIADYAAYAEFSLARIRQKLRQEYVYYIVWKDPLSKQMKRFIQQSVPNHDNMVTKP